MAKSSEKIAVKKTAPKKVSAPSKKTVATTETEQAAATALTKLNELGLDLQLQADLEWCLGSYKFDKNPAGLYEMLGRALKVFDAEKDKKTKGVTAKLITDLTKALPK